MHKAIGSYPSLSLNPESFILRLMIIDIPKIESHLKTTFKDKNHLLLAFVHRSFWNENQTVVPSHNERLEFLGDSVLGLVLAEYLYTHLPERDEGVLSDLNSRLVEATSCVAYVNKLGVSDFILLGKGERLNRGKGRETILADLFEAIMGAIYLDGGYEAARDFFFTHFESDVKEMIAEPTRNWKAELQDYAQKKYQTPPQYDVISEEGPSHEKHFTIAVIIHAEKVGVGTGSSKKEAQQMAAKDAVLKLIG
jgi:ribonuclease-3